MPERKRFKPNEIPEIPGISSFSDRYLVVEPQDRAITIPDSRTGRLVTILNVPKHGSSIEETEGILEHMRDRLLEEGMDTPDLVMRVWGSGEDI
ncbi:MAG: hypothetical protein ACE5Z5_01200 [Candidatus Bathyarchaeia archaeon]